MVTKAERARRLRRMRKPALSCMEYESITSELYGISDKCQDIHYFFSEEGSLLDALDGDDEAEFEFQMAFSVLDEKVNALLQAIEGAEWSDWADDDYDPAADFNSCLVALVGDFYHSGGDPIWGFDSADGDYFTLDKYDAEYAISEAGKRLTRKTKPQMLHSIQKTLRIFLAMLDIREEYDYLKAAFDVLKDENTGLLRTIQGIEEAYELAEEKSHGFTRPCYEVRQMDSLISTLPERCWLE